MKLSKRITFAALLIGVAAIVAQARAQPTDLKKLLVGKWHQEYGPYVTETEFLRNGIFNSITIQKGAPYRLYVQGEWEVHDNRDLWTYPKRWEPSDVRMFAEGSRIEVINENHIRNKLGDVYRVK